MHRQKTPAVKPRRRSIDGFPERDPDEPDMRRAEIDEWHLAAQAPEAPDDYAETLAEELRQNELLAAQDPREPWSCDAHDHPSPLTKHAAAAKLAPCHSIHADPSEPYDLARRLAVRPRQLLGNSRELSVQHRQLAISIPGDRGLGD